MSIGEGRGRTEIGDGGVEPPRYLYHYTDERGFNGIRATGVLNPSRGGPGDGYATHGAGQYLTDLPPDGVFSQGGYSHALYNSSRVQRKVEYWLRIDVTALAVERVRGVYAENIEGAGQTGAAGYSIYLRRGNEPVQIRITDSGRTTFR